MRAGMPCLLCVSNPLLDRTRLRFVVRLDSGHPFVRLSEVFVDINMDVFCLQYRLRCHVVWQRRGEFLDFVPSKLEDLLEKLFGESRH